MRCEELMKKDVVCVSPQDSVEMAAIQMRDHDIGFLPVCDADRKVLGTLTDRDIAIRLVATRRPVSTHVREIMTEEVVACRPEDDLGEAEKQMMENHKSRILCTDDDGRLKGIISLSDIVVAEERGKASQVLEGVSERESHAAH